MSKSFGIALTQDELTQAAKAVGATVVPCTHNPRRVTLLDKGERLDAYSEGSDTTIYFYTGKRIGEDVKYPMPIIMEKLLGILGLLEENA